MKPSGALPPGSLTLTTARLLVLALATKSIDSSGESASELGVLPGRSLGIDRRADRLDRACPPRCRSRVTVLRLALATNRILPPFASSISLGCSSRRPVGGDLERVGVDDGDRWPCSRG